MDDLARLYRVVLGQPCPDHHALPGNPCWRKTIEPEPAKPMACQRRAEMALAALDITKGTTMTMNPTGTTPTTPTEQGRAVVPLPEGHLACQVCGQSVTLATGDEGETFAIEKREGQPTFTPRHGLPIAAGSVKVTRCADCRDRKDRAERIAAAFRGSLARRYRDPALAAGELSRALDAAALVGLDVPDEPSWPEIDALTRHLATIGDDTSWLTRFWPTARRDADETTCAARPWSHVTSRQRQRARALAANVLAERIAPGCPPQPVAPPYGVACLMCGIAAVQMPAAQVARLGGPKQAAQAVWRRVIAAPHSLRASGGTNIDGHVCPACAKAIDHAGSIGPSALERALIAAIDPGLLSDPRAAANRDGLVNGITGWAALRTDQPNRQPWQHMGGREALKARLRDLSTTW